MFKLKHQNVFLRNCSLSFRKFKLNFRWETSQSTTTSSFSSPFLSLPGRVNTVLPQRFSSRPTMMSSSTWRTSRLKILWRRRGSTAAWWGGCLVVGESLPSTSFLRRSTAVRFFLITVLGSSITCQKRWKESLPHHNQELSLRDSFVVHSFHITKWKANMGSAKIRYYADWRNAFGKLWSVRPKVTWTFSNI